MKNKIRFFILGLISTIALCYLVFSPVTADECIGQNCIINAIIIINDTAIASVNATDTITLNGGTTAVVSVNFTASDGNGGYTDLNDSSALVTLTKDGEAIRSSDSCDILSHPDNLSTEYNCSVIMWFYDSEGSWNVNASIMDNRGKEAEDTSQNSIVNPLDYVSQDTMQLSWPGVKLGQSYSEASAPIVLTNGGNQDYSYIGILGHDAIGSTYGDTIATELFSTSPFSNQTAGTIYLMDSQYVQNPDLAGLNSHGASVTQNIYFYLDVPSHLMVDTYNGDGPWSMQIST